MEHFRRLNPPYFKGESQPLVAEHWLWAIEKIFWTIRCEEDEKVKLATCMLEEHADIWWSAMLRNQYENGIVESTWGDFVHLFKSKYIPEHVQDRMEQAYIHTYTYIYIHNHTYTYTKTYTETDTYT